MVFGDGGGSHLDPRPTRTMFGKSRTKGAHGKSGDELIIIIDQELLFHYCLFLQKVMHPPSFSCRCQESIGS